MPTKQTITKSYGKLKRLSAEAAESVEELSTLTGRSQVHIASSAVIEYCRRERMAHELKGKRRGREAA
jgi:hypothetical protein